MDPDGRNRDGSQFAFLNWWVICWVFQKQKVSGFHGKLKVLKCCLSEAGSTRQDGFGGDSPTGMGGPGVPALEDGGSTQESPQPFLQGRVSVYKGPFHLSSSLQQTCPSAHSVPGYRV